MRVEWIWSLGWMFGFGCGAGWGYYLMHRPFLSACINLGGFLIVLMFAGVIQRKFKRNGSSHE